MQYEIRYTESYDKDYFGYPIHQDGCKNVDSIETAKTWCIEFLSKKYAFHIDPNIFKNCFENMEFRSIDGIYPVTENLYTDVFQYEVETHAIKEAKKLYLEEKVKQDKLKKEQEIKKQEELEKKEYEQYLKLKERFEKHS